MTRGFEKRLEIKQEITIADKYTIQKMLMKSKNLSYDKLTINIEDKEIDISDCPIHSFETKEDLLRQVLDILTELNL